MTGRPWPREQAHAFKLTQHSALSAHRGFTCTCTCTSASGFRLPSACCGGRRRGVPFGTGHAGVSGHLRHTGHTAGDRPRVALGLLAGGLHERHRSVRFTSGRGRVGRPPRRLCADHPLCQGHALAPDGSPFTARPVGSRLLAWAEQAAAAAGATVLCLKPWVHNHRANLPASAMPAAALHHAEKR